jgi:low affinity Fe/Cu permease
MADRAAAELSLSDRFSRAAQWASQQCGRAYTFVAAILIILVWAISGPAFHYSDTWQLIINTGTTIITFLMVFLIQNTQNRDTAAIHLKLDELIRANENAHNRMMRLEDLTENQIKHLREFDRAGRSHPGTSGGCPAGPRGSFRGHRGSEKPPSWPQ